MDHGARPTLDRKRALAEVSDDDLLRRLAEILGQSRRVETDLVAHIAEVDERRLYAREAFPSMFAYCTAALHLSEGEAYLRIAVARASREHPMILAMLGDGRLHLSGIALLAPHLSEGSRDALLERAAHRSKRQIEELIAELAPRRDVPSLLRRLPEPRLPETRRAPASAPSTLSSTPSGMGKAVTSEMQGIPGGDQGSPVAADSGQPAIGQPAIGQPAIGQSAIGQPAIGQPPTGQSAIGQPPAVELATQHPTPLRQTVVRSLSPGRYSVQFTASAALHGKLERLQALMRSRVPDGDLGVVIEAAVTEKLERPEARRFASVRNPRQHLSTSDTSPSSRHIPSAVRRAVCERDGRRCRIGPGAGARNGTASSTTIGILSASVETTTRRIFS